MGLRGPPPKPADQRQRRNASTSTALVLSDGTLRPEAPPNLLRIIRERWDIYWRSELARAVRDVHIPVVERLFSLYDERERAYRAVRKHGRVTLGSQNQMVPHPALKYIATCDAEIRQLEDRLGLSPRAMAQLGADFAAAKKSLDDLSRSMESDDTDDTDDSDPRLQLAK